MKLSRTLPPLALAAAVLVPAAAWAAKQDPPPVQRVRIAIVAPQNGEELTVLTPGQEIVMAPGEELLLRLFEPYSFRRNDRRPLAATFGFGPTETPLQIVSASPERGEVVVRLNPTSEGQRWHVGYKLADRIELADPGQQLGRILVRVASPGSTSVSGSQYYGQQSYTSAPDSVVTALYRAILMRNPEPGGATGALDDIARNGYDGVLRAARGIAESEESRIRVYQNGVTNTQRLESLYRELLGWSRASVSREQWDRDLAELDRGNLVGVVDAMVKSEQFRSRFGI